MKLFVYHLDIGPGGFDVVAFAATEDEADEGFNRYFGPWKNYLESRERMIIPLIFAAYTNIHFLPG
jgi:hypothetical protein